MEWNIPILTGEEATAWNIDRLVTVEIKTGGRPGRCIMFPLYEAAVKVNGDRPISLTAAKLILQRVKPGDSVVLMTGMGAMPFMPRGETDGPTGVASLARAISYGIKALPIVMSSPRDFDAVCAAVRAAGLGILDYKEAKDTTTRAAIAMPFTALGDDAKKFAKEFFDKYNPKLVGCVEMLGPNKLGTKHFGSGKAVEAYGERFPGVEHMFLEAAARKVLTIGCVDVGNEVGAGNIEEAVRKHVPFADKCQCPCGGGFACAIKVDVCFPANVSNWAAYAISAMMGYLLGNPDVLQDIHMERRMLEAIGIVGSVDGCIGGPIASADGIDWETHASFVRILHHIVASALSGASIAGQIDR
jgi:hypothetical protein